MYIDYHDNEWGVEVHDDRKHFEFLILESAQAGLSWSTVLRKRENYREAFAKFEAAKVAEYTDEHVAALMDNKGIIRNRAKILAAINNAQQFLKVQQEFGSFDSYLRSFLPDRKPIVNSWTDLKDIPPRSELSDQISTDMKKRGFKFFGSTICYSHLQAVGLINDHADYCFCKRRSK
jgi:DNA-3-methyladenine glycosylase I